jgi:hypothetical protein
VRRGSESMGARSTAGTGGAMAGWDDPTWWQSQSPGSIFTAPSAPTSGAATANRNCGNVAGGPRPPAARETGGRRGRGWVDYHEREARGSPKSLLPERARKSPDLDHPSRTWR